MNSEESYFERLGTTLYDDVFYKIGYPLWIFEPWLSLASTCLTCDFYSSAKLARNRWYILIISRIYEASKPKITIHRTFCFIYYSFLFIFYVRESCNHWRFFLFHRNNAFWDNPSILLLLKLKIFLCFVDCIANDRVCLNFILSLRRVWFSKLCSAYLIYDGFIGALTLFVTIYISLSLWNSFVFL